MESDMARTNMMTLVPMRAPICHSAEVFRRNGWDGMIVNQNKTPVTKKLACMSQMWMVPFFSAASKRAGTCHRIMTRLNETNAVQGFVTNRPRERNGGDTRSEERR